MDELKQRQTQAWVAGWRDCSVALDQVRTEELRALTQEDAGRLFASMTFDPDTLWISPERRAAAGLIEQQRLFMLLDEHPARHQRRA